MIRHIVTICLFLFFVSCQSACTTTENINVFSTVSVKQEFPKVLMLAQRWSADALLFRVKVPIINPNSISIRTDSEYFFESPTNPGKQFVVNCSSNKCDSNIYEPNVRFMDYGVEAINLDDVQVDSSDAAKIALRNGGENILKNSSFHGYIDLRRNKEGTLQWIGYFSGEVGTIYIYIDPTNGEIIEIAD